tara:strand:- start:3047 stop:3745 length:699 start_codon:yes stop_codon:yes gene_type:complete
MSDLPEGAHYWSVNHEISKMKMQIIFNAIFSSCASIAGLFAMFQILRIIGFLNFYSSTLSIILVIWFLWNIVLKTNSRRPLLNMVAIGEGHPWHPSEEIGNTSVWVKSDEKWHVIPKRVRLFAQADPILDRTLLKNNDEKGAIFVTWPFLLDTNLRKVVSLVNQALAFQDAQDNIEGEEDPIENARIREKQDFYPVDREWQDTTPGSLTPQPGALLRQIKGKGFDIVQKDKE